MLSAENLTLGYGSHVLLDGVSLEVRRGVITGLVAPNGYGKTTLLRALAGLGAGRVRGLVRVDDIDPRDTPAMRRAVFYAPGDASLLYPALTVREHLRAAADLWGSGLDVEAMARRCGVDGFSTKRVRTLSQGMKQQVTLAIAYLTGARYLLLDDSKLEKRGFYGFADLAAFDQVYCTRPQQPMDLPGNFALVQK